MMMQSTKPVIQSRYITLDEWAETMFSQKPHINTLRRWVHDGRIQPQPEKIGRLWRVKRDARYVND
jgi:predicted site-specific integrase-resolvase